MSISFLYRCDGCNNEATAGHVRRVFKSFSGRNHGFGVHHVDADPVRDAPDGWVAFDLIGATYCPDCAAEIWPESAAIDAAMRAEG